MDRCRFLSRLTTREVENQTVPDPLSILLVDDHEDTVRSLMLLLKRRGFQVKTATDIAQAVEMFSQESFDVLVSDMGLPDGSGLDLLPGLATPPRCGGIMVSGFGNEEDLERSRAVGYGEHLVKPVDINELEAAIRRLANLPPRSA